MVRQAAATHNMQLLAAMHGLVGCCHHGFMYSAILAISGMMVALRRCRWQVGIGFPWAFAVFCSQIMPCHNAHVNACHMSTSQRIPE